MIKNNLSMSSVNVKNKLEFLSHFENPKLNHSRVTDPSKPIRMKIGKIKSKIRLTMQTRAANQSMVVCKSPSQKFFADINLPSSTKVPFLPLLSIRTNAIEEFFKEFKELKSNIADLEEKNKINTQCIQVNKLKLMNLEECQEKLRQKAGLGQTIVEKKENLQLKLKNLQTEWTESVENLSQQIKDLEQKAELWTNREDAMKTKVFSQDSKACEKKNKMQSLENSRSYEGLRAKLKLTDCSLTLKSFTNKS